MTSSNPGRHECGGFAERRLREAGSGAGAKAAALRTRGNRVSPTIQDVRRSAVEAPAGGAVHWRRWDGAESERMELAESGSPSGGSLRFYQRRQPPVHQLGRGRLQCPRALRLGHEPAGPLRPSASSAPARCSCPSSMTPTSCRAIGRAIGCASCDSSSRTFLTPTIWCSSANHRCCNPLWVAKNP